MINSSFLDGLNAPDDAISKAIEKIEEKKSGKKKINFRLKDWGISRQRYWGCPIPIAYDDEGNYKPVPESQLPIKLPENVNLKNWKLPNIFKWIMQIGGLEIQELLKVFNCGIGMLLYVDKNDVEEVINCAKKQGEECFIVGEIIENSPKQVFFEGNLEKWSKMD